MMLPTLEAIMKRVGIYIRVSTDGQTTANQRRELEAVAARSGWEISYDMQSIDLAVAAEELGADLASQARALPAGHDFKN
jgi:Resolvase, N terminal domain